MKIVLISIIILISINIIFWLDQFKNDLHTLLKFQRNKPDNTLYAIIQTDAVFIILIKTYPGDTTQYCIHTNITDNVPW